MTGPLRWAVKQSLQDYVRSMEGGVEAGDGAELDGEAVVFPADPALPGGYLGRVRFHAHDGMLDWRIAAPRFEEGGTVLSIERRDGTRVPFARVDGEAVLLTAEGAVVFEGFYPAGTALAPFGGR